jgi:hypothetical protein
LGERQIQGAEMTEKRFVGALAVDQSAIGDWLAAGRRGLRPQPPELTLTLEMEFRMAHNAGLDPGDRQLTRDAAAFTAGFNPVTIVKPGGGVVLRPTVISDKLGGGVGSQAVRAAGQTRYRPVVTLQPIFTGDAQYRAGAPFAAIPPARRFVILR